MFSVCRSCSSGYYTWTINIYNWELVSLLDHIIVPLLCIWLYGMGHHMVLVFLSSCRMQIALGAHICLERHAVVGSDGLGLISLQVAFEASLVQICKQASGVSKYASKQVECPNMQASKWSVRSIHGRSMEAAAYFVFPSPQNNCLSFIRDIHFGSGGVCPSRLGFYI